MSRIRIILVRCFSQYIFTNKRIFDISSLKSYYSKKFTSKNQICKRRWNHCTCDNATGENRGRNCHESRFRSLIRSSNLRTRRNCEPESIRWAISVIRSLCGLSRRSYRARMRGLRVRARAYVHTANDDAHIARSGVHARDRLPLRQVLVKATTM